MLSCYGWVGIPRDVEVKTFDTDKGVSLYFDVVSQDINNNTWHRYRAKLWVRKDAAKKMIEDITPRSIFFIQRASWSSIRSGDNQYPKSILVLEHQHFHKMETPLWMLNKQST